MIDFKDLKNTYSIFLLKETYEYYLQHVSTKITSEDLMREVRLHKELYIRHSEFIKNLVGDDFKYVGFIYFLL